jgi:hypothetical protein
MAFLTRRIAMHAPKQPRPDAVSITGRRTARKSDVIQKPDADDAALETYEQDVERPGPDARENDDGAKRAPDRTTPDD